MQRTHLIPIFFVVKNIENTEKILNSENQNNYTKKY